MSLRKNISLNFISQIVNLITSLITSVLLARVLGSEGRGDYILVLTSAGFLVQFFTFGIESSITHFIASERIGKPKLIYSIIVIVGFLSVLTIIGTGLIAFLSNRFLIPSHEIHYYIILTCLVLFTYLQNVLIAILNGVRAFRPVIFISMLTNILILLIAVVFFIYFSQESQLVIPLLYCTLGIQFIITVIYIYTYSLRITGKIEKQFMNKQEMSMFFSYALLAFLGSVIQYLNYKMDFWVINYYWGPANLGIYSLAASLSQLLWIFPQSVALILFPMTSHYTRIELPVIMEKSLRISLFITFLIIIPLLLLSPFFIPLLFGNEFSGSVFYFQLFLLGVCPFIIIKIMAAIFAGIGKVKYNLIAAILGFIIGGTAYLLLIPRLGLLGGVIGSVLSYVTATIVAIYFYRKEFPFSLYNLLIIKKTDMVYLVTQFRNIFKLLEK